MKKITLILLLSIIFILPFSNAVAADDPKGSIAITYEIEEDVNGNRETILIPGAEFKVYKIWTGEWVADEEVFNIIFESGFEGVATEKDLYKLGSEGISKLSSQYEELVNASTPVVAEVTTDNNGYFKIDDLGFGAYLFMQVKPVIYNNHYYMANSFLVSVPFKDVNGATHNDVNIKPKASYVKNPDITKYVNDTEIYGLSFESETFVYSICSQIPNVNVSDFKIVDEMEHVLEPTPNGDLKVTIGDYVLTEEELAVQFIKTFDSNTNRWTITLEFTDAQLKTYKGKELRLDFEAQIIKGSDLKEYNDRKVPNHACYMIGNFVDNTITKYKANGSGGLYKLMIAPTSNTPRSAVTVPAFTTCSDDVHVYVPEKPPIPVPDTAVRFMKAVEENPWILIILIIIVAYIVKKTTKNYRNSN